jgi:hypothetical protein
MNERFITTLVDFIVEQINLQVWMQLCLDVHQHGLHAEFADFILENPGLDMIEIDRQFRNEWDI